MQDNKDGKWDNYLTDEDNTDENVDYIVPNIEIKLPANKRMECREIVKEIKGFGINQRQLLYLIYLLSLEMEDRDTMLALTKAIGSQRDKINVSKLILSGEDD